MHACKQVVKVPNASAPILVTAATGNVGRATVDALLAAGVRVRAASREPSSASWPAAVEPVALDFRDDATFGPAVARAAAVLVVRPPQIVRVGSTVNRFVDAAIDAGVRHCVFLSVEDADTNTRVPHHHVEKHLRASRASWTFLRPGFFAQNLTGAYLADIRRGRLILPAGHGNVVWVDARDVGEAAARILLHPPSHAGKAYHVTGSEALSYPKLARILTEMLGRRIHYDAVGVPRYALHLLRSERASPLRIAVLSLLHTHIRSGGATSVDPALEQLVGHRLRTIRDFVADHVDLLNPGRVPHRRAG